MVAQLQELQICYPTNITLTPYWKISYQVHVLVLKNVDLPNTRWPRLFMALYQIYTLLWQHVVLLRQIQLLQIDFIQKESGITAWKFEVWSESRAMFVKNLDFGWARILFMKEFKNSRSISSPVCIWSIHYCQTNHLRSIKILYLMTRLMHSLSNCVS